MNEMTAWSNSTPASDDELTAVQAGLPVRLIATERKNFKTCRPDEPVSAVRERSEEKYEYWPVENEAGRIIGLLHLPYCHDDENRHRVADKIQPLDETNLMGADASILAFIHTAHDHACRLLLSGPNITGLVSISDLQKLPVRVAIFCLITNLEMTMTEAIRRENLTTEEWAARLSDDRQCELKKRIDRAKNDDVELDHLLYTEFCDKSTILKKSSRLTTSKTGFRKDMNDIRDLRDSIAHASDYAAQAVDVKSLSAAVAKINHWTKFLGGWPVQTC
jgi:hypothetical protein